MNDWLWIAPLLYFLISAIGSGAAKKAKREAQKSRQERPATAFDPIDEEVSAAPAEPTPRAQPGPSTGQKTADEIAAEIRRMMGLPPVEEATEAAGQAAWEVEEPEPIEVVAAQAGAEPSHGGDLHERMRAREAQGRHSAGNLEQRHLEHKHSALEDRHIVPNVGRARRLALASSRNATRRNYVELRDMARAFVTAEVLGPPKALRPDEF